MVANSIQKRVAVALETGTIAAPGVIDYDAIPSPGGLMAITQLDDAALKRAYVDNKTIPRRASENPEMLQALRSASTTTLGFYLAGQTSGHAAAGVSAVRDLTDLVFRSGLGGEFLGAATLMTGGTAANPEVTASEGAPLDEYGWAYFFDLDGGPDGTGEGHFRQIESVAAGTPDVLTMAPDHELPFTPSAGDIVHAAIAHYVDFDVAEDHTDAGNELLRILLAGRQSDDLYELIGAKPEFQWSAIEQGVRTEITMPVQLAIFLNDELGISPALAQVLQGSPGKTVGAGTSTKAFLSNIGTTLATQQFWGGIQFTNGVVPEQVMGPNGTEGVHGYGLTADSYMSTTLELITPYDASFRTDAEAGTEKRFLIQVGNAVTDGPWAVYCPRLAVMDDLEPGSDANSRRQSTLRFKCHEALSDGETGAVTTTGLSSSAVVNRAKAKWMLLRVA